MGSSGNGNGVARDPQPLRAIFLTDPSFPDSDPPSNSTLKKQIPPMPPASRPEKSKRQTFAALLAFVFLTPFAFSDGVLIPPERIEQVKAEWKQKTHGRPVVVNWLYMSVRRNQDPQHGMTGEPMFRNFVASVELARKHKIPTTFIFEHQTLMDPQFREFMMREMRDDPLLEPIKAGAHKGSEHL